MAAEGIISAASDDHTRHQMKSSTGRILPRAMTPGRLAAKGWFSCRSVRRVDGCGFRYSGGDSLNQPFTTPSQWLVVDLHRPKKASWRPMPAALSLAPVGVRILRPAVGPGPRGLARPADGLLQVPLPFRCYSPLLALADLLGTKKLSTPVAPMDMIRKPRVSQCRNFVWM